MNPLVIFSVSLLKNYIFFKVNQSKNQPGYISYTGATIIRIDLYPKVEFIDKVVRVNI